MKRSDNLRLVFINFQNSTDFCCDKNLSQTLKISCDGTLKLACKLNFTFHMLGHRTLDNGQSTTVSPSILILRNHVAQRPLKRDAVHRTGHGDGERFHLEFVLLFETTCYRQVGEFRTKERQSRWQFETNVHPLGNFSLQLLVTKGGKSILRIKSK